MTRVGVILDPENSSHVPLRRAIEEAKAAVGVQAITLAEIERAIASFADQQNGGLIVFAYPVTIQNRDPIIALAARHRLPSIYMFRYFVSSGGLMAYGVDQLEQWRSAAGYVDRILKGEMPGDLPVQSPTKYQLVINRATAKALGLSIPPMLLATADEMLD
jgi:putative ABC transport system substrate-binding protein